MMWVVSTKNPFHPYFSQRQVGPIISMHDRATCPPLYPLSLCQTRQGLLALHRLTADLRCKSKEQNLKYILIYLSSDNTIDVRNRAPLFRSSCLQAQVSAKGTRLPSVLSHCSFCRNERGGRGGQSSLQRGTRSLAVHSFFLTSDLVTDRCRSPLLVVDPVVHPFVSVPPHCTSLHTAHF